MVVEPSPTTTLVVTKSEVLLQILVVTLNAPALMGGAVFASLDGQTNFATVPERVELALRGAISGDRPSGTTRKADRLPPAIEPNSMRRTIPVTITSRSANNREVLRVRPFIRIAGNLLRRVRDYAQVRADGSINREVADAALKMLDVDGLGFDLLDRKLLLAIIEKFSGGPVGVDNLAAAVGEESETIEDVLEPFLIQQGFLQRTPRGRIATPSAWRHFGLAMPRQDGVSDLFSNSGEK